MSINHYMNNLLSNQHIKHRKPPRLSQPAIKASLKADLWLNTKNSGPIRKRPGPDQIRRGAERRPLTQASAFRQGKIVKEKRTSFSVPIFPLVCFCMLLAGIYLVAGNRDLVSSNWMSRDVISLNPPEDSTGDYNMALYTGITPSAQPSSGETGIRVAAAETAATAVQSEEELPLDLTETFAWKNYTVKRGDSVSGIAKAHALSMDAVIASNNITNARLLRAGEVLQIPNMDGIPYTVKRGDSLSQISRTMGVPLEAILDANNIERDVISAGETLFIPGARMRSEDLKLALGELFVHPVRGARLSSPFGWRTDPFDGARRYHAALDLAAPQGTPVVAAMDGEVIGRGFDRALGNYIVLKHQGGLQTVYAHLHSFSVSSNTRVRQGAQIGTVGSTGRSTGPHLHFMVYKNGQTVNPIEFLRL